MNTVQIGNVPTVLICSVSVASAVIRGTMFAMTAITNKSIFI